MIPDWPLVLEDTSVKLSRVSEDCTRIPEYRKHGNPKGYGQLNKNRTAETVDFRPLLI